MSAFHDSYTKPHTKIKHNATTKKSWSCNKCDQTFPKLIKLSTHLEVKHKVEVTWKPYKCNICSKSFYYKKAKETHIRLHRDDGTSLRCKFCGKSFRQRKFLVKHQALESICEVCGEKLECSSMLLRHKRRHGNRTLQCSVCSMKFTYKYTLKNHMASHSKEKHSVTCEYCNAVFTNTFNLKRHTSRVHDSVNSLIRYSCFRCNSNFKQKDNCWRHYLRVHCNLKRFLCGICGADYSASHVLRKHLKRVHMLTTKPINKEANLDVRVIPENSVIEGILAENVQKAKKKIEEAKKAKYFRQISHPNQSWKCDACGSIFPSEESLRSHVNARLSCNYCQAPFCSSENLQSHVSSSHPSDTQLLLHLDVLQCSYCDAVFLSEEEYQRHVNTHLVAKQLVFSCNDCNLTFLEEKQLAEHKKNGHGEMGGFGPEFQIASFQAAIEDPLPTSVVLDKLYYCSQCNLSNLTAGDAITHASCHRKPVLKEVNLGLYSCTYCSAVVFSEKQLQEHCQSHIGPSGDQQHQPKAKDMLEMLTRDILTGEDVAENEREAIEVVTGEEPALVQILYNNESANVASQFVGGNQQDVHGIKFDISEVLQNKRVEEHQETAVHIVRVMDKGQPDVDMFCDDLLSRSVRDHVSSLPPIKAKPVVAKEKTDSSTESLLQFPCKYCTKSFSSKLDLKAHSRDHAKEKSYFCRSCGKHVKSQQTLRDHEIVHSNMKPYKCDICKKAFSRKKAVSRHQLIHEKMKNSFACPLCGKKFQRRLYLKNVHIPSCQRPLSFKFRCKLCLEGFASRTKLWQHTRLHTKNEQKPHQCSKCSKCFRLPRYLKAHQTCCFKKSKKKKTTTCDAPESTELAFPMQFWDTWVVQQSEELDKISSSSCSNTDTLTKDCSRQDCSS